MPVFAASGGPAENKPPSRAWVPITTAPPREAPLPPTLHPIAAWRHRRQPRGPYHLDLVGPDEQPRSGCGLRLHPRDRTVFPGPLAHVATHQRCRRPGCASAWATLPETDP